MLAVERQLDGLRFAAVADGHRLARSGLAPYHGERDRPESGGDAAGADHPDLALAEPDRIALGGGLGQPQSPQSAVRLAPVVKASHGLLTDVASLREAARALVQPRLLGDRLGADVQPEPRSSGLDPQALGDLLRDLLH